MPDKITLDDALTSSTASRPPPAERITFDDAMADREAKTVPHVNELGGQLYGMMGQRLVKAPKILPPEEGHFGASVKSGIAQDPQTRLRILADSLFPDDPKGIERVGFVEGNPVYVDDKGQLRYVSGGLGRLGAGLISNAPEIAGSIIGTLATGHPILGSAAGGAGGRALKRGVSALVFDEPVTPASVGSEMALEGATNVAGGLAGKGISKVVGRGRVVDFTPAEVKTAEQARSYIKTKTGIDVDLAQASGNRKLIALRAYAARFPGKSAEMVQAADDVAEGQLDDAVNRTLNLVAKATPQETATANGVNAAQMVIKTAREKVYNEVRPLYEAAYRAVPVVDDPAITAYMKLPYFREAFRAGQRIAKLEGGKLPTKEVQRFVDINKPTVTETTKQFSLESLDYTKRALDDKIAALIDAGKRQEARALQIKRAEFVDALDALPNQQWQLARQRYGQLIKETVEPLEQGPVGVLASIENPRMATRAAQILADRNLSPEQIRATRTAIESKSPEAWNGLVRQYMSQAWNKALKETQGGDVVNPAGKFRQALIGTPADKARMQAMLPPAAVQTFDDLMKAAEALARTPISGSNTMRDIEIKEQLKGTGAVIFKWITSPRQSVRDAAEQKALERATVAITEGILDPAKRSQLRQVVKMAPSTQQAILISTILSAQAGQSAVTPEPEIIPRALPAQ